VVVQLHALLGVLTGVAALAATLEGLVRWITGRAPGSGARRTQALLILAVAMSASAGLALVIGGHTPHEWLHLMYALLALGLIPVSDHYTAALHNPRTNGAIRFLVGALTLVVLYRSAVTG